MKTKHIPANLPECFTLLEEESPCEALDKLRRYRKDELIKEHLFGWGIFLRNRFIHPRNSPLREKIAVLPTIIPHHDSYGDFLLEAFWAHLNGYNGPESILKLLTERWQGVADVTKEICKPEELNSFLESWEADKPTLEDVLPLFKTGI